MSPDAQQGMGEAQAEDTEGQEEQAKNLTVNDINEKVTRLAKIIANNYQKHEVQKFRKDYLKCVLILNLVNKEERDSDKIKNYLKHLNKLYKEHARYENVPKGSLESMKANEV